MKALFVIIVFLSFTVLPQNKWLKLNGPEGGVMQGLISKGDTLITGTAYNTAIAFYSFDRGEQWHISDTKVNGRFSDFCFTDDGGIIAANPFNGVYKSYDFVNWTRLNVNGIFWSVGNDKQGKIYAGADNGQLYSSSNNGISWSKEMEVNGRIYNFYLSPYNKLFAGGFRKILVKDLTNSAWTIQNIDSSGPFFRIFEGPSDLLFAVTVATIRLSSDSGKTWQRQPTGTFFYGEYMLDCIYNNRVIGAFGDETQWYGIGWGAAVSDDLGVTWEWSQTGLPPKISGQRMAKSGTDTYMTTWGAGVFKSTDYGGSWFAVNRGITAAQVFDIHFDSEGVLYSASWGSGLSKSTDKGESWKMINNGVTNADFFCIESDDNGILFAGSERGTFRSTDKGEHWSVISSIYATRMMKDNQNRIYAGSYGAGLYRITDQGDSWVRLDKNFSNGWVYGMAIDSSGVIYSSGGGDIYKSTDDGESWTKVYQGISGTYIMRISLAPNGDLYAASWTEGILKSTDQGLTWELKNNGLPNSKVSTVSVSPSGYIYISFYKSGSPIGIYVSSDGGDNWQNITDNMEMIEVREFLFRKNELYLATDESVWKSNPDSLTSVTEDDIKPKEYFLSQNYPNPFNPSTTIKYSLPQTGRVTLSIYDLLGREVVKLIDEEKPAGEYETKWNASSHPSGVYFMRMQAGEFSETRKVVLVK
jgi:photosystem II stability/assembly factor-like uncharacterized protein